MIRQLHAIVSGHVQGVCYRYYCRDAARGFGLAGWVRNMPDGRVEVVAEGEESGLQSLVAWCREGPPAARVSDVAVDYAAPTGRYKTFEIAF